MKIAYSFFLFFLLTSCNAQNKEYFPENNYEVPVIDDSNLFSISEKNELSYKLIDYADKTTRQMVVVAIDSIKPYNDIQKYASDLGNHWGVGQKETANGLLIVIVKPLKKVAISTGYGTQKVITDSICQNLINEVIVPKFKKQEYYQGVSNTIDSIIKKWK